MRLDKITIQFTKEEIEALHYVLEIGVRSFNRKPLDCAKDWVKKASEIRKKLPIELNFNC